MAGDGTRKRLSRRWLLGGGLALGGAGLALAGSLSRRLLAPPAHAKAEGSPLLSSAPRARFWSSTAPGTRCTSCHASGKFADESRHDHGKLLIKCGLCARGCVLAEGERGMCRARVHHRGELRTLVYGRPMSIHVDPIEKKPFYHFLPGASAYSLCTSGCPLRCKFCQNWEISQASPEDYRTPIRTPAEIAREAGARSPIIAFTYNEPTVFTEYLLDIATEARKAGTRSVLISCGYMQEEPLAEMCKVLSAIKIDLKGFSPEFYKNVTGAELAPVLRSIKQIARSKVHLEIVNLVVPTLNDSEKMLEELARWVVGEIGPDVPIHFTRFHPDYQLPNLSPTPVATLERARDIARSQGIRHAYVGNVPGHPGNSTLCHKCGKVVIERSHFFVVANRLDKGRCASCQEPIAGVWA